MERHKFNMRSQKPGETKNKNLHIWCITRKAFYDRFVCGIHSDILRKSLLRDPDLNLTSAVSASHISISDSFFIDGVTAESVDSLTNLTQKRELDSTVHMW